jgi:hypothetical protein
MARESLALLAEHAELASNTDWEQNSTVIIAASPRLASPHLANMPVLFLVSPS